MLDDRAGSLRSSPSVTSRPSSPLISIALVLPFPDGRRLRPSARVALRDAYRRIYLLRVWIFQASVFA